MKDHPLRGGDLDHPQGRPPSSPCLDEGRPLSSRCQFLRLLEPGPFGTGREGSRYGCLTPCRPSMAWRVSFGMPSTCGFPARRVAGFRRADGGFAASVQRRHIGAEQDSLAEEQLGLLVTCPAASCSPMCASAIRTDDEAAFICYSGRTRFVAGQTVAFLVPRSTRRSSLLLAQ